MANLRKLTGVLRKALNGEPWAGARVNIRLLTDPATQAGEVFPVLNFTFHTAVDGSVPDNVFVATPDSGAWRYLVGIHGNTPFVVYIEGTGDISLDDLIALANLPGQEPGEPVSDWLVHLYGQSLLADPLDVPTPAGEWRTLGTAAEADTADFDPAGSAAAAAAASIPRIAPAVAGELVVQQADGTLAGGGYAVEQSSPTGASVVRRGGNGELVNNVSFPPISAMRGTHSGGGVGVEGISNGTGMLSQSTAGTFHHQFGNTSGIARTTGALTFLGASAAANRLAQSNEINAVNYGAAQTLTAPQQAQARTNIGAETSGAAATVQGNLTAHENLTTTAHGGIVASTDPRLTDARTPTTHAASHATAGSDPISPASIGAAGLMAGLITVNKNGGAQYTTITAALAAAVSGNTVLVYPETYDEHITIPAGVRVVGVSRLGVAIRGINAVRGPIVTMQGGTLASVSVVSNASGWTYYGIEITAGANTIYDVNVQLAVELSGTVTKWGIKINNVNAVQTIQDCVIRTVTSGLGSGDTMYGIYSLMSVGQLYIRRCFVEATRYLSGLAYGIWVASVLNEVSSSLITGTDYSIWKVSGSVTVRDTTLSGATGAGFSGVLQNTGLWQSINSSRIAPLSPSVIAMDSFADAAVANNSLYYSTTLNKLVYKDTAGVVNALY